MEPLEEYHSPFDFEQGVNASYLYLSPAYNDTPPSSPAVKPRGDQELPDSVPEVGEDAVTSADAPSPSPSPTMTEEEREELQKELDKVEEEIQTLTQVLAAKELQLAEIKRKLGITTLNELKQNITKTWQEVTTSIAYRRTSETLSQAGQKASAAFTNMGSAIRGKFEDVSTHSLHHSASMPVMRNAPTFKPFETLKTKMTPSASTSDPADQDSDDTPVTSELLPPQAEDSPTKDTLMH